MFSHVFRIFIINFIFISIIIYSSFNVYKKVYFINLLTVSNSNSEIMEIQRYLFYFIKINSILLSLVFYGFTSLVALHIFYFTHLSVIVYFDI